MRVSAYISRSIFFAAFAIPILTSSVAYSAATDITSTSSAAEEGDAATQVELGEALLYGLSTDADPDRARVLLKAAAEDGNVRAMQILGEQLIWGWFLERDVAEGLALIEQAVSAGDAKAQVALGNLYLYGGPLKKDKSRALALFEAAAAQGDGSGLRSYGSDIMWKWSNPTAAEAYLKRAGKLGDGAAWTALAEGAMYGYFGEKQRRRFSGFAAEAVAMNETRIAVLEAQRRLYGINMRASGPMAIDGLEQAAEAGNPDAARFLIALVRDGNNYNVRKRPRQAEAYLDRFAQHLTETDKIGLAFAIKAARTWDTSHYDALAAEFDGLRSLHTTDFGKDLYAANPNLAMYILQKRWQRTGDYRGAPDGYAGEKTIRALRTACRKLPITRLCRVSVMHPDVIGQLIAR